MGIGLANGVTLATFGVAVQYVAPSTNVTGLILAPGTQPNQSITLVNESLYTLLMHTNPGVSNVADSATASAIPALGTRTYTWNTATGRWYATSQAQNFLFNVKDFGAVGDGVTDCTIPIAGARLAASQNGGIVFYPPGRYITGNQTLYSNVADVGSGAGISILQLKNGANTDLFSAQTSSINMAAAGNTGIIGTLSRFQIKDLTLDGNSANQTGGPSYPLRFYGYDFLLSNLEVTSGYSGGIQCDWNYGSSLPKPSDQMEARFENIKIHDCSGIGLQMGGPHDSRLTNILSFNNTGHAFHFAPNVNGVLVSNSHAWGGPNTAGVCLWLIEVQFGCNFYNCVSDGGFAVGVAILGTSVTWKGQIYTAHAVGVQLGQTAGNTPFPGQINQSGGLTTDVQVSGTMLDANISGCPTTSISVQNEVDGFYQCYIFQTTGSAITGTFSSSDVYQIHVNGLVADGTVAKSGGMQMISSANPALKIFSNTGASLFHIDGSSGGTSGVDVPGGFHVTATGGFAVGTAANSNDALLIAPNADGQAGLLIFPHSVTQSAPLLAVQNRSFSNVFTVDLNGAMQLQAGSTFRSGSGAPSGGVSGDYYFRTDTPGTANQRIYVNNSGSWIGIA